MRSIADVAVNPDDFKEFHFGRWIAADLSEQAIRNRIESNFQRDMDLVEKSLLNGFQKLWLYQFYVLSFLAWPFLVQDLVLSFAVKLRKSVSVQLKKWAGVYRGAEVGILFRSNKNGGLQLTPTDEHFQRMQLIKCSLLKSSHSANVRRVYEHEATRTSRMHERWRPSQALQTLEASVEYDLRFCGQVGRSGLGAGHYNRNPSVAEKRKLMTQQFSKECQDKSTLMI